MYLHEHAGKVVSEAVLARVHSECQLPLPPVEDGLRLINPYAWISIDRSTDKPQAQVNVLGLFKQSLDPKTIETVEYTASGPDSTTKPNFAALGTLESFRGEDGKLELRQCWPGNDEGLQAQHWKQASNPFKKRSPGVEGYEAIDCPHSTYAWGGLEAGHSHALLNGSVGAWWFYAIGSYQEFGGGIPGPSNPVKCVELHARKPGCGEWVLVMRQTVGGSWWRQDLWNTATCCTAGASNEEHDYAELQQMQLLVYNSARSFTVWRPQSDMQWAVNVETKQRIAHRLAGRPRALNVACRGIWQPSRMSTDDSAICVTDEIVIKVLDRPVYRRANADVDEPLEIINEYALRRVGSPSSVFVLDPSAGRLVECCDGHVGREWVLGREHAIQKRAHVEAGQHADFMVDRATLGRQDITEWVNQLLVLNGVNNMTGGVSLDDFGKTFHLSIATNASASTDSLTVSRYGRSVIFRPSASELDVSKLFELVDFASFNGVDVTRQVNKLLWDGSLADPTGGKPLAEALRAIVAGGEAEEVFKVRVGSRSRTFFLSAAEVQVVDRRRRPDGRRSGAVAELGWLFNAIGSEPLGNKRLTRAVVHQQHNGIVVSGAGSPRANGAYARAAEKYNNAPLFLHEDFPLVCLRRLKSNNGKVLFWEIFDEREAGSLYNMPANPDHPDHPSLLPTGQSWSNVNGVLPAPLLELEGADVLVEINARIVGNAGKVPTRDSHRVDISSLVPDGLAAASSPIVTLERTEDASMRQRQYIGGEVVDTVRTTYRRDGSMTAFDLSCMVAEVDDASYAHFEDPVENDAKSKNHSELDNVRVVDVTDDLNELIRRNNSAANLTKGRRPLCAAPLPHAHAHATCTCTCTCAACACACVFHVHVTTRAPHTPCVLPPLRTAPLLHRRDAHTCPAPQAHLAAPVCVAARSELFGCVKPSMRTGSQTLVVSCANKRKTFVISKSPSPEMHVYDVSLLLGWPNLIEKATITIPSRSMGAGTAFPSAATAPEGMRVIDVTEKLNKMILKNGVRAPTGRVESTKNTDGVEPTKKNKRHTLAHAFKSELGDGVASFELVLEREGKRISIFDEHPKSLASIGKMLGA